jgi:hypothetical protein
MQTHQYNTIERGGRYKKGSRTLRYEYASGTGKTNAARDGYEFVAGSLNGDIYYNTICNHRQEREVRNVEAYTQRE